MLALLLGLSLGASHVMAGEESPYRFIAISAARPIGALGINNNGLASGAYVDPATGNWFSFLFERGE